MPTPDPDLCADFRKYLQYWKPDISRDQAQAALDWVLRRLKTPIDPTLNTREWATLKRAVPRDVYEEFLYFEALVAQHSGIPPRFQGIGHSVSVWSVTFHHLRSTEAALVELAKEWGNGAERV